MVNVTLKPITQENWKACIDLEVKEEQKNFVAPNMYSLAEAAYQKDANLVPLGVYDDGAMVGFVMYGYPEIKGLGGQNKWFIFRLMVDQEYQGKGYGRAAMVEVIKIISAQPGCDDIYISYEPANIIAARLYESLGFINEGLVLWGELVVHLPVKG